ncbi:hypothetical protein AVEN_96049-1 [Araneus ventricosus]|uniref:Uncharacterized protein n=1 Tax=Araneus ventricosus TaxID=182803 RepID=A0A4Y2B4S7_ARAVE|nr:hypothetical protein AVEN_96049-1 [Araneus ventricosus]
MVANDKSLRVRTHDVVSANAAAVRRHVISFSSMALFTLERQSCETGSRPARTILPQWNRSGFSANVAPAPIVTSDSVHKCFSYESVFALRG